MEVRSDESLVRLVRQGDTQAFDELVVRYLRAALAVAVQFGRDLDDAEDIAQEAFMRALRQLHRYDDRRPFRPWFFTILRNIGRNAGQARKRRSATGNPSVEPKTMHADAATNAEIRQIVGRELSNMSEQQAACFRWCEIDGFTAGEVADMMGVAPATVRTHVHRARLKLRAALAKSGYGSANDQLE